jgi:hypothetical protein
MQKSLNQGFGILIKRGAINGKTMAAMLSRTFDSLFWVMMTLHDVSSTKRSSGTNDLANHFDLLSFPMC